MILNVDAILIFHIFIWEMIIILLDKTRFTSQCRRCTCCFRTLVPELTAISFFYINLFNVYDFHIIT